MISDEVASVAPRRIAFGALLCAIGAAVCVHGAEQDEDHDASDDFALEEVIVTADRQEQSLLDVPISVTAFDADALEDYQITGYKDLEVRVPGLQIGLDSPATIRGIGSLYRGLAGDVAVAEYSNDLYFNEPYGVSSSLYDIERVEILRGPQGSLYGRNSIGGAINYVSKRPATEFGAGVTAELSSFGGRRLNGFVTGPISDQLAFRLTVESQQRDGNQENITGPDFGARDDVHVSPQLAFRNDWLDLNLRYSTFDQDAMSEVRVPVRYPSTAVEFHPNPQDGSPSEERNQFYRYPRRQPPSVSGGDLSNRVDLNNGGRTEVDRDAISFHAKVRLSENWGVKYIYGGSELVFGFIDQDFDGSSVTGSASDRFLSANAGVPFVDGTIRAIFDIALDTHELHVTLDTERLSAIAGMYLLDEDYMSDINIFDVANRAVFSATDDIWRAAGLPFSFGDLFPEGRLSLGEDRWIEAHVPDGTARFYHAPTVKTVDSKAVFGQASYEIDERWRVTLGLRYTEDNKKILQDEDRVVIGEFDPFGGALLGDGTDYTRTAPARFNRITPLLVQDFDKVTGNVSLEYTMADGQLIYGRVATGYRSGGPVIDRDPPFDRYDDEELTSYEVGFKGDLMDERLRVLVSGFVYDFGNYQQVIRHRELEPVPRQFTVIDNLPDTTLRGLEIDLTVIVTPKFRLSGFYAWQTSSLGPVMASDPLDPNQTFDAVSYMSPFTGQEEVAYLEALKNLEGNELPNMPNHKWSVTADREFTLGDRGTFLASTTFSFTGERFNRIQNIAYDVLDSHTRWDASLSWVSASQRTSATFYVENLTDEIGIMELESNGWSDGYYQDATLTDPRFIGFVVRWEN